MDKVSIGFPQYMLSAILLILSSMFVTTLLAQESMKGESSTGAGSFALPVEAEFDSGAPNGNASFLRFLPVYSFSLKSDWRLINLNLITLADAPGGVPGRPGNPNPDPADTDKVFGLSDIIHASFFTPPSTGKFIWGLGPMLGIPTATDTVLGSGKWAAGVAARLTFRSGAWNLGAIAGNRWSFAGDEDRADVNQLMIRGAIRRQLPNNWYFVSAPIITANWNASSGQKWLVPVGGGFGKVFEINSEPWAWSIQAYANVIKPDGAPDWAARFAVVIAIPSQLLRPENRN